MYYVLTEAEGQDGFLTGRMKENFIGSRERGNKYNSNNKMDSHYVLCTN